MPVWVRICNPGGPSRAQPPVQMEVRVRPLHLADKTGLCLETGTAGMLMPRGQATTIG